MLEQTWLKYLDECRRRFILCLAVLVFLFCSLAYFANDIYTLAALPLLHYLPHHQGLIATEIGSLIWIPYQVTLLLAVLLAMPFFLYQGWAFILPALYDHERRWIWSCLLLSTVCFYTGLLFAYFVVIPLFCRLLIQATPSGVTVMPEISHYIQFFLKVFFLFGILFEIPMLTLLITITGVVKLEKIIKMRSYIIIGTFVIAMFVAPDVLSQIVLAIPIWLLFEFGIVLARFFRKKEVLDVKNQG